MDPLTVLSVAGNIVQFIQFGCQIVSKGQQIYRLTTGSLTENVDIETVANDFRALSTQLKQSSNSFYGSSVTADEKALHEMCDKCIDICNNLIAHLEQLKVKDDHHRKWKSFRQALKSVWNEKELDSIAERLLIFGQELETHILVSLKAQQTLSSLRQDSRFDTLDLRTQAICTSIFENRSVFEDSLRDQTAELAKLLIDQHEVTRRTICEGRAQREERVQRAQRQEIGWTELEDFGSPEETKTAEDLVIDRLVEDAILKSLRFRIMTERHDEVAEAHGKTFEWIFRESKEDCKPWSNFVEWLQTGTGIYWINGKAASGKSTLMRYIIDNPQTRERLKKWAKEDPLNIAGFFFWNSGTREQKSHKGLLRTLLFQTLDMQRELIPLVFPSLWKTVHYSIRRAVKEKEKTPEANLEGRLSLSALKDAFKLLTTQTTVKTKICFFVDGLDEYEGDVTEMVELFVAAANSPNVKICLSSRPWLVFEDGFRGLPGLRLQDLTNNDITYFVNDKLSNNRRWVQLATEDPEGSMHLVDETVTKAHGVFLWVKLVVISLLNGLGNHDDIEDLEKRLQLLPADLEKLYMHIITRIEPPFYLEQAAKIFQIVRAAREARGLVQIADDESPKALTIMELALADGNLWSEEIKTARFVLSQDDMRRHAQRMANRLKTRCGGLLELGQTISSSRSSEEAHPSEVVVYLHRTVKDYLEQDKIWETILNYGEKTQFHPCISLLRSSVLSLKLLSQESSESLFRPGYEAVQHFYATGSTITHREWSVISLGMIYAHWCEVEVGNVDIGLLEELDRVATFQHKRINPTGLPWSSRRPAAIPSSGKCEWQDSFLSFAVEYGLHSFLREKLSKNIKSAASRRPLLDYATFPISGDFFPVHPLISYRNRPKVVALLLERGASPNEEFLDTTPWQNALYYAYTRLRPQIGIDKERLLSWLEVFTLLVEHGAKTDEFCNDPDFHGTQNAKGTWQRRLSVLCVVNTVFMAQIPSQTAKLHTVLVNRGAKEERKLALQKPRAPPKSNQSSITSIVQTILVAPYQTLSSWNWSSASRTDHTLDENSQPEKPRTGDKLDRTINADLCNSSEPREKGDGLT